MDFFCRRRHVLFYADSGGFQSTDEENYPLQEIYYLGIIDIFTEYNVVKKIEHYWKSVGNDKVTEKF